MMKRLLIMLTWGGVSKKFDSFCNKSGICLIFSSKMNIYVIYIYTYDFLRVPDMSDIYFCMKKYPIKRNKTWFYGIFSLLISF